MDFYETGGPGDSYYRESSEHYVGVAPRRVEAITLDDLVATNDVPPPDLIKADLQGAEIDALRGGRAALGHAQLVLLECALAEFNPGAPTIADSLGFMRESGFSPLAFLDPLWQGGEMVQIVVLFGRRRFGST